MISDQRDSAEEAMRTTCEHLNALLGVIRYIVRDPILVNETFSDVAVEITKCWDQYDRTRPFECWAAGIARTVANRNRRRASRQPCPLTDYALEKFAESFTEVGDESYFEERCQALEHCLLRLPPRYRELVEFRYFQKESYETLAERMGKTVAALRAALHRVNGALSECILRQLRNQ
jgi:RNA polymerase sigma-70 factor (ECF subfamily)